MRHMTLALAATALATAVTFGAAEAKTLVVGVADNLTTLDPPNANDTLSAGAQRNIYQGLYGFDSKMQLDVITSYSIHYTKLYEASSLLKAVRTSRTACASSAS